MLKLKWNGHGRRLAMVLYVSAAIFIAAHILNTLVANALLLPPVDLPATMPPDSSPPPPPDAADSPDQNPAVSSQQPPQQLARMIENSGIFLLPPASAQRIVPGGRAAASAPPMEVAKKINLIGTAAGGDSAGSAILEDPATKVQKLFRLHDSVPNVGELAAIDKDRVLFRSDGQEEWLTSIAAKALADSPRFPVPDQSVFQVAPPQPVQKPVRNRHVLDRGDLLEWLSDIPSVFVNAQAASHFDKGKFEGIRLDAVNYYGFFGKIGLQSGDILKSINGFEMRDQASLATVLHQLKQERRIALNFVRKGEPRTLSYIVR